MMNKIIRFMLLCFLCVVLIALPYLAYSFYMLQNDRYTEKVSWVVYHALKKGKQQNKNAKKVIFGDSVGNQLYYIDDYNDTLVSLATNQAVGIIGQYLLLKNYSDNNDLSDKNIYLVLNPLSFKDNLNQNFTFNYFLKPFYTNEFQDEIDDQAMEQIEKIPFYWASQFPIIKTSTWSVTLSSPLDFEESDKYYISDVSLNYLKKIKTLAEVKGAKLLIVSPFLKENKKEYNSNIMKTQIHENGLQGIFAGYFENIKYLPDSMFVDNYHINKKKFHIDYNPLGL